MNPEGNTVKIFTDGGSRGNPGPSACAFVVYSNNKETFKGYKFLGIGTNNEAEYSGVILAFDWIINNKNISENLTINFFLDSELVVNQINGVYKINKNNLRKLVSELQKKRILIKNKILFTSVARENNKQADRLVNICLDENI